MAQTYYKMSYVDRTIDNPEHRLCEDIPRFCDGVSDLLREVVNAAVDAVVFTVLLRRYSRTHKYTLAIVGYVFGAGVMTLTFMPNFSRMNRKQQELEGALLMFTGCCSYSCSSAMNEEVVALHLGNRCTGKADLPAWHI